MELSTQSRLPIDKTTGKFRTNIGKKSHEKSLLKITKITVNYFIYSQDKWLRKKRKGKTTKKKNTFNDKLKSLSNLQH